MATYLFIFLLELISAYIVWFVLRRLLRKIGLSRIAIIALAVSLIMGYVASYRIVGYQVTLDYLTIINNQRIEETEKNITLQEENEYKEELFRSKEFQELLTTSAVKLSVPPFLLVLFIALRFWRNASKSVKGQ